MPRLIWSPAALRDVERLHRFLGKKNREAAGRAVQSIRAGIALLRDQPGAGRPVEDMEPEFREWQIAFADSGYVTLYRFDGATVMVLAVRHQREVGY